jgi:hypothetical protein
MPEEVTVEYVRVGTFVNMRNSASLGMPQKLAAAVQKIRDR